MLNCFNCKRRSCQNTFSEIKNSKSLDIILINDFCVYCEYFIQKTLNLRISMELSLMDNKQQKAEKLNKLFQIRLNKLKTNFAKQFVNEYIKSLGVKW